MALVYLSFLNLHVLLVRVLQKKRTGCMYVCVCICTHTYIYTERQGKGGEGREGGRYLF